MLKENFWKNSVSVDFGLVKQLMRHESTNNSNPNPTKAEAIETWAKNSIPCKNGLLQAHFATQILAII